LWDVAPDHSAQGLVTRGTYRSLDAPGAGRHARFQIAPQGYRFPAGHKIKLEVAANDLPYYQQDNIPSVVQVSRLEVTLPLHEDPAGANAAPQTKVLAASARAPVASLPATGGAQEWDLALALLTVAGLGFSARSRGWAR
jgi:predicted acyl esterase